MTMKMTTTKIDLLKSLFTMTQENLHSYLEDFLISHYGEKGVISVDGQYMFARGDVDVLVVAHLDTVHKVQVKYDDIWFDQEKNKMIAPGVGIGADDRCGVFMIINLILEGYLPHVAFTWNEEIGGVGARFMVDDMDPKESGMKINFAIEFDRRGHKQAVFYDLDNKSFEDYIAGFGFDIEWGSYTDICEICPAWEFAGVNLSTGYVKEHTALEEVWIDTIIDTFNKTVQILEDQIAEPKFFEWKEVYRAPAKTTTYYGGSYAKTYSTGKSWRYDDDDYDDDGVWAGYRYAKTYDDTLMCDYCNMTKHEHEMRRIQHHNSICNKCSDFLEIKEESFYKRTVKEVAKF